MPAASPPSQNPPPAAGPPVDRESELRLRQLFRQAPSFICILSGPDHVFEFVNDAYYRVVGFRNLIGKTVREAIPEIEGQGFFELLDNVYRTGEPFRGIQMPVQLQATRDSVPETRFVDFIYQPIRDAAGNISGIFVEGFDDTQRVAGQAALQVTESKLQMALDAAGLGTFLWFPDEDRAEPDARMLSLFGLQHDSELTLKAAIETLLHPGDRDNYAAAVARALDPEGDGRLREEVRVRWPDGSDHWLSVTAQVRFDGETRRATSIAGMAADITERKRVEEALKKASAESARWRRLYEAVLANTPDLGYVFDLDHRFVFANDALLTMWGKQWAEAIGKNCLELGYEPWHAEMHDREIEQVIATRQSVRGVVPFNGAHGRRIYDYIFFPVIGANGEVEAVGGTTRDITEIKNAEQALRENAERIRQSEKLAVVGRLASSIAHEINNPLEAVTNLLYLARREPDPSRVSQFLDQAQEELERVSLITRETLRFHRQNSSPARADLAEVMDSVLRLHQGRLRSAQVTVEKRYRRHPDVVCLPDEIRQVLANLVGNAVDAMGRNSGERRLCLGMTRPPIIELASGACG